MDTLSLYTGDNVIYFIRYHNGTTWVDTPITDLADLVGGGDNPQNVGQFINLDDTQSIIDLDKAKFTIKLIKSKYVQILNISKNQRYSSKFNTS